MDKNEIDLINKEEWEKCLEKIKDKKIIIFGAGNNGETLLELLPYKVSYFIDNDKFKWNKQLNNIKIKNPEDIKRDTEEIVVLVCGYLYEDMIKQLKEFGISEKNIYNVYLMIEDLLNKKTFFNRGTQVINFLKGAKYELSGVKNLDSDKTSILISNFCFSSSPFYLIVIAVMMKMRGNSVELIWDDVEGIDEIYYNKDNITTIQNEVIEKVLNYVNIRFDIKVIKVSEMELEYLDEEDLEELKKLSNINTISKYRKIFFDEECKIYEKECFKVLKDNMKQVKMLFQKYEIKKILSFTGIHRKTGLYTWYAKKNKIKVLSYDAWISDILITTDGICTHFNHIEKIVMENRLDEKLLKKCIKFSEENFNKRLNTSNDIDLYVYQKTRYNENINKEKYDIVIPLNISWDAGALGYESTFKSMQDWLIETIEYILKDTDKTVVVRQHPAERFLNSGEDIKTVLQKKFSNSEKFKYISSDDDINTYNLIKNSKLVLPYTSTIGIESVLLKKPVIMATYNYYANSSFVRKAKSKEEYFSLIKKIVYENKKESTHNEIKEAKIFYALMMLTTIPTIFTDLNMNYWVKEPFEKIYKNKTVQDILDIFESGDPIDIYKSDNMFS